MIATAKNVTEAFYLALVIWREARGEPDVGKIAVGYTVMNRVARPKWWGKDVASVVTKKWQYSSMTDPKDRQLTTWPLLNDSSWIDCLEIALTLLGGGFPNPVPGADSYYDDSIAAPYWTKDARFVAKIGRLNFYDVDKDYEVPDAT